MRRRRLAYRPAQRAAARGRATSFRRASGRSKRAVTYKAPVRAKGG